MKIQDQKTEEDQLIDQAAQEISEIQCAGQMLRAQIDAEKERALNAVREDAARKRMQDADAAEQRMKLIRKMSEAAKSGDSVEMQRIQKLLRESKS